MQQKKINKKIIYQNKYNFFLQKIESLGKFPDIYENIIQLAKDQIIDSILHEKFHKDEQEYSFENWEKDEIKILKQSLKNAKENLDFSINRKK